MKHISTKNAAAQASSKNGTAGSRSVLDAAQLVAILATHNGGKWIERVLAGY